MKKYIKLYDVHTSKNNLFRVGNIEEKLDNYYGEISKYWNVKLLDKLTDGKSEDPIGSILMLEETYPIHEFEDDEEALLWYKLNY